MDLPFISIVTPSFNSGLYIEQSIKSVLDQGYKNFEHIIIDGGSTDGTVDILRKYPHLQWISEADNGQAEALNKGFRLANGEIIGWLNADDFYTKDSFSRAIACLLAKPSVDVVYGNCQYVDEGGRDLRLYQAKPYSLHNLIYSYGLIHTPSVFWRRQLFDNNGYIDTRYHYSLDNEFWLRACPNAQCEYINYSLGKFRIRKDSKTGSKESEFTRELLQILKELFLNEPYTSELPTAEKRLLIGRIAWTTGVVMCQNGQASRAQPYLNQAIQDYDILRHPKIAAYPIVVHYLQGYSQPESLVSDTLAELPLPPDTGKRFYSIVWKEYLERRFYLNHQAGHRRLVRLDGLKMIVKEPSRLLHRGFMSTWLSSLFGVGPNSLHHHLD